MVGADRQKFVPGIKPGRAVDSTLNPIYGDR